MKVEHRGKGVGKALIDSLRKFATNEGAYEVWVLTEQDNEPAQHLYSSFTDKKPSSELMFTMEL